MAYVIYRKRPLFRREWLVQENPELWGERNFALIYCKEGDAKHVGRRLKKAVFVENIRMPPFIYSVLVFSQSGNSIAARDRDRVLIQPHLLSDRDTPDI